MPCPHNEISIVQRSQQQSAIAAAAYQSGEKLFCEYDQQVKHYPEKRGMQRLKYQKAPGKSRVYCRIIFWWIPGSYAYARIYLRRNNSPIY